MKRVSIYEEKPAIDENIEVKRMKRSEQSLHNLPRASAPEDLSPPRKKRVVSTYAPRMKEPERPKTKTGLVSSEDIKEEIARTKKQDYLRFKEMDPSISGRGAEGIRRDKRTGERLSKEHIESLAEKPKEIELEWGRGLAQKREAEERSQELELEKAKPFARTRDDPELESMLKEKVRWGDPMANLIKKKKHSEVILPDLGDNEKMKESGFLIPQQTPKHSWLNRRLEAPPTRYADIKPGRHWDGVDRGNGFEIQLIKTQNEKLATKREAYLWSVSDM